MIATIWPRVILHVDMDAFYASVEQRDHPELFGQPVIVGGTQGRGVVAAASYEVRRYGVHSAMPMRRALELCPHAICVRPRMAHYAAVSGQIFDIFRQFTPLVQGLSLDEAFLDISASQRLLGTPATIAAAIKAEIRASLQLNASIGVASNKLVAKIASDLDKPDGLRIIEPERVTAVLDPLPIGRLPGLGRKKGGEVANAGITTLGELRQASESTLRRLFGRHWQEWQARAAGIDDRPVLTDHAEKSISNERTFALDLSDPAIIRAELYALADKVAARLRAKRLHARCLGIKVRQHDFTTLTRQATIAPATDESRIIVETVQKLLADWLKTRRDVKLRLLGVSASDLIPGVQGDLFASAGPSVNSRLDGAVDGIRQRFGAAAVGRASLLPRHPERQA